jgi:PmbA protein
VRNGAVENAEGSSGLQIGLRVIVNQQQACVTTNKLDPASLQDLLDKAIAIARVVPPDPFCGLADPSQLAQDIQHPPFDSAMPSLEEMTTHAQIMEAAALSVPGVTMAEGAQAGYSQQDFVRVASNGFVGGYRSASYALSVAAIAANGEDRQIDGYGSHTRFLSDLASPSVVGRMAGERAARRLNPRKAPTGKFPVVYENLVSGSLLGHLLEGISGSTIADKTSFLQGALHSQIFPQNVLIWDDPFLERGLGSHPFDGEGLGVRKLPVVENGRLTTWLLNLRAARQLGLTPTGHGTVAVGSPPGIACSNFYMSPGSETLEQLLAPITSGFFVTDLMGHTVNGLTGDYSLGASGFWIESGSLAYPVQGLTIAGNLRDMFKNCTPADDLQFRSGVDAPTLRIDSMSVAGGAV